MMSSKGYDFPQTPQIHPSKQTVIIIFMCSLYLSAAVVVKGPRMLNSAQYPLHAAHNILYVQVVSFNVLYVAKLSVLLLCDNNSRLKYTICSCVLCCSFGSYITFMCNVATNAKDSLRPSVQTETHFPIPVEIRFRNIRDACSAQTCLEEFQFSIWNCLCDFQKKKGFSFKVRSSRAF